MSKFNSQVELASLWVCEVEVVSVVVVGHAGDSEELPEPVYHVAQHRALQLWKYEDQDDLVDLQRWQVEGNALVGDCEEQLVKDYAERESYQDGLEDR